MSAKEDKLIDRDGESSFFLNINSYSTLKHAIPQKQVNWQDDGANYRPMLCIELDFYKF